MSTRPHAFVVMPFGIKQGPDGESFFYDDIYRDLIQPALTMSGLESFRADYERRAGQCSQAATANAGGIATIRSKKD
jgi:hypothetical protein